jgi:hypothetical protein
MSHYEYCLSKNIDKDTFNKITRGYYLDNKLVFYKDNFIYDNNLIKDAINHLNEIVDELDIDECYIYFGQLPDKGFALDYFYGKYVKGKGILLKR